MTTDHAERKLAAIFAADVAGYSRLMGIDEEGTLERLKAHRRELIDPKIAEHHGRIVNATGDGMLIEFASVVDAVRCAVEVQQRMGERNADVPGEVRIEFRVGINLGDIIIDGDDIHGDGVNIAARLEGLAEPGTVYISGTAYEQVRDKLHYAFENRGEQSLKNIARPVRVYRVAIRRNEHSKATHPALTFPDKPSIAVLPFQNMSGDPEQEYFADGLTEDIITELSRIRSLSVIARNSAFVYKGKAVDVKQVGRDLGVRYVLEGSVRRAGHRLRITAQLVESETGNHVWAEKYDRELADIFDIQDDITRSVVGSTQVQVVISEGKFAERNERPDFRAWDLAKRGWRKIYELKRGSFDEADGIAREVIHLDASFSKGHQLLAAVSYHRVLMGFADDPKATLREALGAAQEAMRLDEGDEYSPWLLGGILGLCLGQYDKAIAAYRRALDLNPSFSVAYGSLGSVLALAGRLEESISNSELCIRLNPTDPSVFFRFTALALAYFLKSDYTAARDWAQRSVSRKREWWVAHAILAASNACLGEEDQAVAAVQELLGVLPDAKLSKLPPLPLKNPEHTRQLRDALRRAGLPE
jgi:adenylate cyclase